MRYFCWFALCFCLLLTVSCRHVDPVTASASVASIEADASATLSSSQRLGEAERMLQAGELEQAQQTLAPLLGGDFESAQVADLALRINSQLALKRQMDAPDVQQQVEQERKQRLDKLRAGRKRLEKAQKLIDAGKISDAEECLADLNDSGLPASDI